MWTFEEKNIWLAKAELWDKNILSNTEKECVFLI